ncbi:hypothetical protein Tco_0948985 [Tanacetum coccineum]
MSFTLHSLFSLGTKVEHVGLSDIESQGIEMRVTITGHVQAGYAFPKGTTAAAERVKSIVEKAERDKRSVLIDFYDKDVRGDPDQRHKTFLRSFADPCLFTPKLVFPIAVLEHKYIKLICTGYLDSATKEAMEEFRRFEEETEQQSNKELQGLLSISKSEER